MVADPQDRPLRFADAAQEERFQTDRQTSALWRARVTMIVGIFVVASMGMLDVIYNAASVPEFVEISLWVRFGWVAPIWLGVIISSYLPRHVRRADALYAIATVLICWGLAVMRWSAWVHIPNTNILTSVALDVTMVMLMSFFTLPVRLVWIALAMVGIVGGITGGLLLIMTVEEALNNAQLLGFVLLAMAVLVLVSVRAREVTERRLFAQREELTALNAELSRLNAEKNEFMTIAAHDLRSPLAAVNGVVLALQLGQIKGVEKVDTTYRSIQEMTRRMLGLVDDYLGAHAIEHATLPVRRERLDLAEVVTAVARRQKSTAQAKEQTIRFDPPVAAVEAVADASQLAQILENFLSNALKFSPAGAEVEIALLQAEDGSRVRIEVIDQGPGVPVSEQGNLFRMFGRTSVQPTAGEKSHGIGLAVTKRLAESMGGSVGCESPVTGDGTGSAFWVELKAR